MSKKWKRKLDLPKGRLCPSCKVPLPTNPAYPDEGWTIDHLSQCSKCGVIIYSSNLCRGTRTNGEWVKYDQVIYNVERRLGDEGKEDERDE